MSAKEMFEKLGFKCTSNDEQFISYSIFDDINRNYTIIFRLLDKDIHIIDNIGWYEYLKIDVLKAINKQVEELGWNNE